LLELLRLNGGSPPSFSDGFDSFIDFNQVYRECRQVIKKEEHFIRLIEELIEDAV
jgi:hypothetical protein